MLPKTNAEAQAAFDEGVRLMKMGRSTTRRRASRSTRATELDGRLFEAWHDLGVIETSLGNFDKAVDDFERALNIQPGARKTPARLRGVPAPRPPPEEGGVRVFEVAERRPERLRDARRATGKCCARPAALDESLEQARLLRWDPPGENVSHTVIAYNALALTYYKMGKYELAETALKKASDLDPRVRLSGTTWVSLPSNEVTTRRLSWTSKRLPSWTRSMCKPA